MMVDSCNKANLYYVHDNMTSTNKCQKLNDIGKLSIVCLGVVQQEKTTGLAPGRQACRDRAIFILTIFTVTPHFNHD